MFILYFNHKITKMNPFSNFKLNDDEEFPLWSSQF